MKRSGTILLVVSAVWLAVPAACAQSGSGYDLSRNTIDGGGATFSTSGSYQLGGTVGQPDAGLLNGGGYTLAGGFWTSLPPAPTPTTTPTQTATNTPTPSLTATLTTTRTPSVTATAPATPTGSLPPAATPTITPLPTATWTATARTETPSATVTSTPFASVTPTPTTTPHPCVGDCSDDRVVTVDEILTMVNIALGNTPVADCPAGDRSGDGMITVDEILAAVNSALNGCP